MYTHFYVHIDLHKILHTIFRRKIILTEGKKKRGLRNEYTKGWNYISDVVLLQKYEINIKINLVNLYLASL